MGDIKSALEIAMEKVEKLDKATNEEQLKWKYIPEGERLAVSYLKEDSNLVAKLSQCEENAKRYIIQGAAEILIRYIDLPKDDLVKRNNRKAMDGLKTLKSDKVSVENVYSKIRRLFDHYTEQGEQQRRQAYGQLKIEFGARVRQAIQQQLGPMVGIKINVESQPQFQEEWRKIQAQLNSQYLKLLDEYKQELSAIA